jgi:5'-nucleotidase
MINMMALDISDMTLQANIELRKKVDSVLKNCRDTNIPFLVFSAGIGDIIKDILRHENLYFENMHTVSNMMVFNDKDVCVDFREPLIHVFNKSEFQLETTPYHAMIEERRNVILMGDSLGDLQMSQGLQHDLCLNIGFLNHDIKSLEPAYTKSFDLVIEGDANMQPVMDILEFIE